MSKFFVVISNKLLNINVILNPPTTHDNRFLVN